MTPHVCREDECETQMSEQQMSLGLSVSENGKTLSYFHLEITTNMQNTFVFCFENTFLKLQNL